MMRLSGRLVIATHNSGKLKEISSLIAPFGVEAVSAGELSLAEPEETGTLFAENAALKALAAARASSLPALADDSGLCVDALDGAPGIFSARWGGENKDFSLAMRRVWTELELRGATSSPQAHFVCALCLAFPDGKIHIFEGRVFGTLTWPPRGTQGFGYDPFFIPQGSDLTFGEMEPDQKHAISHRAQAFAKFCEALT